MSVLFLNGSPRKKGAVATLLREVAAGLQDGLQVEWIDVYDLEMRPCIACMKCRPDQACALPPDDAHRMGELIRAADGLVVGTPTHWGNMSAQLKLLFDRNVPAFMGEKPNGFPIPNQKGKPAAMVVACSTPWPFNVLASESRGAARAVHEVLHYGGYRILGRVVKPGSKKNPELGDNLLKKSRRLGQKISSALQG